jgi:hypothetical protein
MISVTTKVNSFYLILSGYFIYKRRNINDQALFNEYSSWAERLYSGNFQPTFSYFRQSYYDGYKKAMIPELDNNRFPTKKQNERHLTHLTHKDDKKGTYYTGNSLILSENRSIPFTVAYVDLFLFPDEIGLFSVKIVLNEEKPSLDIISAFQNGIRSLESHINIQESGNTCTVKNFIEEGILKVLCLTDDWADYNPQLKIYSSIELDEDITDEEMDSLLFDFGNMAPIGSARSKGRFSPSASYFNQQIRENKLSVFQNWSALALYDTFTRISVNYPDQHKSWEHDYFLIYIHCLYIKFCMYIINSKITNVTHVTSGTQKLRNQFIDFVNDNYHHQISYKFLPDLLKDKIMFALEGPREIEMMEVKINRINQHLREKRERTFNLTLLAITILSIFPVVYNFSEWLVFLGIPRDVVYPYPSLGVIFFISLMVFLLLRNRSNKRK